MDLLNFELWNEGFEFWIVQIWDYNKGIRPRCGGSIIVIMCYLFSEMQPYITCITIMCFKVNFRSD